MRRIIFLLCCIYLVVAVDDWLITPPNIPVSANVIQGSGANSGITFLQLTNGLISRTFTLNPNFATIDLYNHMTNVSLLRGVKPEAQLGIAPWRKPTLMFDVGGLLGQEDYAYLNISQLNTFTSNSSAFQFVSYKTSAPTARYFWKPQHHSQNAQWPPAGLRLTVTFKAPKGLGVDGIYVHVHYEMYENIPVIAKWVTVKSNSSSVFTLETLKTEILAVTEEQVGFSSSQIDTGDMPEYFTGRIELDSEWTRPFWGTTRCDTDPAYTTKAQGGCNLLSSVYPMGPDQELSPTESFESFRSYVLVHNDDDRERQGLAVRRMYRTIAPQITENPIFFHLMNMTWDNITNAVDQCSEVGWEMVILSFGSDFDILNKSDSNIEYYRQAVEYAHSKGIEMGGYTLMASSVDAGPEYNCIDPETGQPEQNACLASAYSDNYFETVLNFVDSTGFDVLETDGPYEGAQCASTEHEHHHGLEDSTWKQYEICMDFYEQTRQRNIYINSPDPYYLRGTNKDGMGYVEQNWSLPRWEQLLLARQNIYDGTWRKIPTQGWMFCPLTVYEGGGAEATLEPLNEHLKEYEWYLATYFGSGVQAAWRGWRLYDTDDTKALVTKYVAWFNQYRTILTSDIIHVKRADGRSVDAILHVNADRAACKEAGFAMVYNSSPYPMETTIRLPLYYTGLTDYAMVREQEGQSTQVQLARDYSITVQVKLDSLSFTWFVIEPPTTA